MTIIPVSALRGDNACVRTGAMPWYDGPVLLDALENMEPVQREEQPFRMPVQWVARRHGFRGLSGTVVAGSVKVGDKVALEPLSSVSNASDLWTEGRQ